MNNKLLLFLCKLFSYLPILRVTDDTRFGEIDYSDESTLLRLRISLISFNLGKRIFHLITFNKSSKEFEIGKIINLEQVCNYPNDDASKRYDVYKEKVNSDGDLSIAVQKEALLYKINQLEDTNNKTFNKYVAYIAIVTLILPLYAMQLVKLHSFVDTNKVWFLLILSYILVNLLLFFNEFIKVRGYKRTLFKSVQDSDTPLKEFTGLLFYEWRETISESSFQVSLIKNIEKYMKGFVITSFLILFVHTSEQYLNIKKGETTDTISSALVLTRLEESSSRVDFLKINDLELTFLKEIMLANSIDKIIVLYNKEDSSHSTLIDYLDMYNEGFVDIIEVRTNVETISVIVIEED